MHYLSALNSNEVKLLYCERESYSAKSQQGLKTVQLTKRR